MGRRTRARGAPIETDPRCEEAKENYSRIFWYSLGPFFWRAFFGVSLVASVGAGFLASWAGASLWVAVLTPFAALLAALVLMGY